MHKGSSSPTDKLFLNYHFGRVARPLHDLVEGGDESLGQPEGEDELGTSHQQFRHQTLEEGRRAFVPSHVGEDLEAAFRVLKVSVLYSGLNHVQRRGHDEGC